MVGMHTHCHVAEVQFGAKTWAIEKAEKKNKEANGAATWRRDISSPTALHWLAGRGMRRNWARHHFKGSSWPPSE